MIPKRAGRYRPDTLNRAAGSDEVTIIRRVRSGLGPVPPTFYLVNDVYYGPCYELIESQTGLRVNEELCNTPRQAIADGRRNLKAHGLADVLAQIERQLALGYRMEPL